MEINTNVIYANVKYNGEVKKAIVVKTTFDEIQINVCYLRVTDIETAVKEPTIIVGDSMYRLTTMCVIEDNIEYIGNLTTTDMQQIKNDILSYMNSTWFFIIIDSMNESIKGNKQYLSSIISSYNEKIDGSTIFAPIKSDDLYNDDNTDYYGKSVMDNMTYRLSQYYGHENTLRTEVERLQAELNQAELKLKNQIMVINDYEAEIIDTVKQQYERFKNDEKNFTSFINEVNDKNKEVDDLYEEAEIEEEIERLEKKLAKIKKSNISKCWITKKERLGVEDNPYYKYRKEIYEILSENKHPDMNILREISNLSYELKMPITKFCKDILNVPVSRYHGRLKKTLIQSGISPFFMIEPKEVNKHEEDIINFINDNLVITDDVINDSICVNDIYTKLKEEKNLNVQCCIITRIIKKIMGRDTYYFIQRKNQYNIFKHMTIVLGMKWKDTEEEN